MLSGQNILIAAIAVFTVWYFIAIYLNHRRAKEVRAWLEAGLESEVGAAKDFRWLRPTRSAGMLTVGEPFAPFRKFDVVFALEWRENLPVWLFRRLRGRRDELIVRADLRFNPAQEIEVGRVGSRGYESYIAEHTDEPMQRLDPADGFAIARKGRMDLEQIERLKQFLAAHRAALLRLSLQRKSTHLMMRIDLHTLQSTPAQDFFASLKSWL